VTRARSRPQIDQFVGRWQRLVNNIYKKSAARDQKISKFVKENPTKIGSEALTNNPDPFVSYQEMFAKLLPGKTLEPIDPKAPQEFHYRIGTSKPMPFMRNKPEVFKDITELFKHFSRVAAPI
jgi:hypothetical protein